MITLIQFYDEDRSEAFVAFLPVENLLQKHDSDN